MSIIYLLQAQFDLVDVKMKIKYGTKKTPQQPPLAALRQNDQICEAVLDTFSDDYLNYISHLVKKASSPIKNKAPTSKPAPQLKARRYSQTSAQLYRPPNQTIPLPLHPEPQRDNEISNRPIMAHRPKSPASRKEGCRSHGGAKKKKVQYNPNDSALKNQKTLLMTKNHQSHVQTRLRQDTKPEMPKHKSKKAQKTTQKYYTTIEHQGQSSSEGEVVPSIEEPFRTQTEDNNQDNFISNIDNYLLTLQDEHSASMPKQRNLFNRRQNSSRNSGSRYKSNKHKYTLPNQDEEGGMDIREMMKENMKLRKKVKTYEQRIEDLDDEISGHLIKCKERDRSQKNKINELLVALNQAVVKMDQQKQQISSMKGLLKHFGQQVRQMQSRQEHSSSEQELADELMRQVLPKQCPQAVSKKQHRLLQATMPKHEQQRRFW